MSPKSWDAVALGSLIERFDSGVSVICENRARNDDELGILKLSALSNGAFNPEEHKAVKPGDVDRPRTSPKADRILISRSNTAELVGASAYVKEHHPALFLPDTMWQLEPSPMAQLHMPWLALWLDFSRTRAEISKLASGTSGSMKKISKASLATLRVDLPPPSEQKSVAKVLTAWDSAIATTERLLANSYKQKQALARNLLMPDAPPDGWRRYRLGELLSERNEAGRDDLPLLSITRDEGVILREDVGRKDTSNEDKSKYLRICKGDIGYNTMRMWQGVSAVSSMEGIVSPAYTVLVPTEKIDARYAAHLFKITNMVFMFYRHSQGMVSDTWSLKYKHFAKILVTIPSRSEQERIVQVLSTADEMASVLGKTLERLRREKSGLMQQLLTGKRRVRLSQPAEVEFA